MRALGVGCGSQLLALHVVEAVEREIERWVAKGVRVVSEPRDESFGRTFVVADPDGNLIRVAPVD